MPAAFFNYYLLLRSLFRRAVQNSPSGNRMSVRGTFSQSNSYTSASAVQGAAEG